MKGGYSNQLVFLGITNILQRVKKDCGVLFKLKIMKMTIERRSERRNLHDFMSRDVANGFANKNK